jgi:hypothetical protein
MATTTREEAPASQHKRRANELIHESLSASSELEPIAFFCECASPRCFETVWMTAAEYEKRRRSPRGWSLRLPGH